MVRLDPPTLLILSLILIGLVLSGNMQETAEENITNDLEDFPIIMCENFVYQGQFQMPEFQNECRDYRGTTHMCDADKCEVRLFSCDTGQTRWTSVGFKFNRGDEFTIPTDATDLDLQLIRMAKWSCEA